MTSGDPADDVRVAAGLPDDAESWRRADTELGNQLCGRVQAFLARVSSEWDVDLFFDTYGRPPRDGSSWSAAILAGLATRADLAAAGVSNVVDESRDRAVAALRGGFTPA